MLFLLGLAGGLLMVVLDSVYFIFASSKYERDKHKYMDPQNYFKLVDLLGYFVVGAVFWYGAIIFLVLFPLSIFCVHSILNSNEKLDLIELFSFWFVFLAVTRLYWTVQFRKKKKEVDAKRPPDMERKPRWF